MKVYTGEEYTLLLSVRVVVVSNMEYIAYNPALSPQTFYSTHPNNSFPNEIVSKRECSQYRISRKVYQFQLLAYFET